MYGRIVNSATLNLVSGVSLLATSVVAAPAFAQSKSQAECIAITNFCIYHWYSAGYDSQDACLQQDFDTQCGSSGAPDPRGNPEYGNPYADKTYRCTGHFDC